MKLYYSPGACSQAPHIVLREAGIDFTWEKVDLKAKTTETGQDFRKINPKGYVPALEVSTGVVMTELAVLLQYIADLVPARKLAPPPDSAERYALQTWLVFIATEIHKGFSPMFKPTLSEEGKDVFRQILATRLDYVQSELSQREYLMPGGFSVADIYLFVTTGWATRLNYDLSRWPAIVAFRERIAQRPAVQAALKAEGLQ
ncbi:glutathione transferase GstA [Pigmentiphaga sp. GD03639]|jgi:glutathione S-transferase|uniref:glutathione transferase GstA n=1 Tax=unclassified Pigmentiphaga TaxID=2626614 RepID=UPI000B40A50D|nr:MULTISPECIES: glutathione transferase GstA [unclassified Pigmentiphaga]MDH2236910.1 glutathione transferase GstA [Pigmentiphaga sp. GD03639]OVZ65659.1 glutathione transferase GstA [Pigmentiphaga sp. NML030171]